MNPEEMIKSEITLKNATAETSPGTLVSSQPPKRKSRLSVKNTEERRGDHPEAEDANEDNENLKNLKFVPKMERNIEKDQKPVQNLFQAIFGENDEEEEEIKDKQICYSDSFNILEQPTISTKPKISPEVANLLRNMSPPCGIFASLFGASEPTEKNNADNNAALEPPIKKQCTSEEEEKLEYYGPALPTNLQKHMTEVVAAQHLDAKVVPSEQRISSEGVEIIEKWVEKNYNNSTVNSDSGGDSSIIEKKKHKYKKSKKTKKSKKSKKKSKKTYKEKQHKSSKH